MTIDVTRVTRLARSFGVALRMLARQAGFSQTALAAETGISRVHINRMMNNHVRMNHWMAMQIAPAIGMTPVELLELQEQYQTVHNGGARP